MPPSAVADAAPISPVTRRIWPTTAILALLAILLTAYQLLACFALVVLDFEVAILKAFYPHTPLVDAYISAGMACLTTLPAFAAMIWCGWQRGSRLGLLLISGPAAVMVLVGVNLLDTPALTSVGRQPRRALRPEDLFGDLTSLNWATALVFAGVAMATHLVRRRARRTDEGSAT